MLKLNKWYKVGFLSLISSLLITTGVSQSANDHFTLAEYLRHNLRSYEFFIQNHPETKRSIKYRTPSRVHKKSYASSPVQSTPETSHGSQNADAILKTAESMLGIPYIFGATGPHAYDCSGFVQAVFKRHGIMLPRNSRAQSQFGMLVRKDELRKGDLVFVKSSRSGSGVGHSCIYAGNGMLIHTYSPQSGGVRYDSMSKKWLNEGFVVARRVLF